MATGGLLVAGIVLLLGAFGVLGVLVSVRAIASARAERRALGLPRGPRSLAQRARDYVGPVDRSNALATWPVRVLIEFAFALGGFPGLGWMFSGRMVPGILLISIVPSFVWGLVPLALSVSGVLIRNAYSVVIYLPALALASATALAVVEARAAGRSRRLGSSVPQA